MNATLTKALYDRFPGLFQDHDKPMTETCMCWGFAHEDGWNDILVRLCEKLDVITNTSGIKIIALQVKEKFGTGRFYYRYEWPEQMDEKTVELWGEIINDVVNGWEHETAQTCEVTGDRCGSLCKKHGWYKTLCDEKAKELGFEKVGR